MKKQFQRIALIFLGVVAGIVGFVFGEKGDSMMRIILKILLFLITLSLAIILFMCEFVCIFGTMLFSILSVPMEYLYLQLG